MKKEKFKEGMALLCEVFEKEPTELFLKAYWLVLKNISDDDFEKAVIDILKSKIFNKIPTPGEIYNKYTGDDGLSAWLAARAAASRYGPQYSVTFEDATIHSVIRDMGGWIPFCSFPLSEAPWRQKDFERLYSLRKGQQGHPEQCVGMYWPENQVKHEDMLKISRDKQKSLT